MDGRNGFYIIGKSVDCSKMIDEFEQANQKVTNSVHRCVMGISLFIMLMNYIIGLLEGKELSRIDPPSIWQALIAVGLISFDLYALNIRSKKTAPIITKYKQFCSTESLVLDNEKIYGSTTEGSIRLNYEQIGGVSITSTTCDFDNVTIGNDVLEIRDIVGNVFAFYSFSNCREIKNIIDMQINRWR